jgi:hypothetical protein
MRFTNYKFGILSHPEGNWRSCDLKAVNRLYQIRSAAHYDLLQTNKWTHIRARLNQSRIIQVFKARIVTSGAPSTGTHPKNTRRIQGRRRNKQKNIRSRSKRLCSLPGHAILRSQREGRSERDASLRSVVAPDRTSAASLGHR